MRAYIRLVVTASVVISSSCGDEPNSPVQNSPAVLFIGNSLTYTNDLPRTFRDLVAAGGESYRVESVARPNVALIDFFSDDGEALAAIDRGGWEYVVMQQGPTYPGLCADTLGLATQMFSDRIRMANGRPALMMTWPTSADRPYFDGVHASYKAAADDAGALFIPAGDAWRIAWANDPSLQLYGPDDYHPSPLGTYLTALVVFERVTGKDARSLPPSATVAGQTLSVAEETIRLLQAAAHEANAALVAPNLAHPPQRLTAHITC